MFSETNSFNVWARTHASDIAVLHHRHEGAQVKLYYENGDYYKGTLSYGLKSGSGIEKTGSLIYSGEFSSDMREGAGSLTAAEDYIYDGHWQSGLRAGHGMEVSPSSGKYTGNFCNDKREGEGILIESNGEIYAGLFKNGMKHGRGKI